MKIHPFRAHRPPAALAAEVASVPYDVITTDEARAMAAGRPRSFLHVIRPEIDLPVETDIHADEVYGKGRENLERFIREIPLLEDGEPSIYVYRLTMGGRSQTGVVACCAVDDYDADRIRKHEKTRRDKEDDRTRHVVEMRCQAEPIFLAFRDRAEVDLAVAAVVATTPLYEFVADDGVGHTLWKAADVNAIVAAFEAVPLLYVADGHHRSASASRARAQLARQDSAHSGNEEYDRVLAVMFPAGQLAILPYNRAVLDLGSATTAELLTVLRERFVLVAGADPVPARRGDARLCVAERGSVAWYGLRLEAEAGASVIESLDVSLLQDRILRPLLGIDDPRTSDRIEFVGGIRGTAELERLVASGRAAIAFSLFPTSIDELMAVADAGEIMPPKSTWFEPKLRSGLFLHRI